MDAFPGTPFFLWSALPCCNAKRAVDGPTTVASWLSLCHFWTAKRGWDGGVRLPPFVEPRRSRSHLPLRIRTRPAIGGRRSIQRFKGSSRLLGSVLPNRVRPNVVRSHEGPRSRLTNGRLSLIKSGMTSSRNMTLRSSILRQPVCLPKSSSALSSQRTGLAKKFLRVPSVWPVGLSSRMQNAPCVKAAKPSLIPNWCCGR